MDGQPNGRSRWFTVTLTQDRATFALWLSDPRVIAPAGDRFDYCYRLDDWTWDHETLTFLEHDFLSGKVHGVAVDIPDGRKSCAGAAAMSEVAPEKWQCRRCLMTFQIKSNSRAEYTRCAEPCCGKIFWHVTRPQVSRCLVGMDAAPKEVGL
jgi:hypothetical protein